jgi:hypothetical protein
MGGAGTGAAPRIAGRSAAKLADARDHRRDLTKADLNFGFVVWSV